MDWAQSLIDFVIAAIASKQPNAVINLSFDLTQTNADGSVTTRSELVNAVATEREAFSLKSVGNGLQQFGNAVGQGAKAILFNPPTQFAGGSSGSGGGNSGGNPFSGLISSGRKFFSERKSELKQLNQDTSSAYQNGKAYFKEKQNRLISEVTTGATNVKNQIKSTTSAINEATRIARNAVSDSTTDITQTSSRIGDNLKQYSEHRR
ncbi:MAG: hypothetical protein V7K53_21465 [Nostoc sp.]|uniref:hypothetical protein n=1 Tax=Nostoc sp. TaxID=1180 RepID=UPI002FF4C512